jgi:hypothetical protein
MRRVVQRTRRRRPKSWKVGRSSSLASTSSLLSWPICSDFKDRPLIEYLRSRKLSEKLLHMAVYTIAMADGDQDAKGVVLFVLCARCLAIIR